MLDTYFVVGIIAALLLTASFIWVKWRRKHETNAKLDEAIAMLLNGYAVVGSIKVFLLTFDGSLPIDTFTRTHIAIGGFVALWMSLGGVITRFRPKAKPKPRAATTNKRRK